MPETEARRGAARGARKPPPWRAAEPGLCPVGKGLNSRAKERGWISGLERSPRTRGGLGRGGGGEDSEAAAEAWRGPRVGGRSLSGSGSPSACGAAGAWAPRPCVDPALSWARPQGSPGRWACTGFLGRALRAAPVKGGAVAKRQGRGRPRRGLRGSRAAQVSCGAGVL